MSFAVWGAGLLFIGIALVPLPTIPEHTCPTYQIDGSSYTSVPLLKRNGTLDHLDFEVAENGDRGVVCTELQRGVSCLVVGVDGKVHELGITPAQEPK